VVSKSANARWSVSCRVKKTSDVPDLFEESSPEDKARVRDDYEHLRAYALHPIKAPLRPLGLDLWLKKGFLSWTTAMLRREAPVESVERVPEQLDGLDVSTDLRISLANILFEWSKIWKT